MPLRSSQHAQVAVKKGSLHPANGLPAPRVRWHLRRRRPPRRRPPQCAAGCTSSHRRPPRALRLRDHLRQPAQQRWFARRLPPRLEQAVRCTTRRARRWRTARSPDDAKIWRRRHLRRRQLGVRAGRGRAGRPLRLGAVLAAASTGASTVAAAAAGSAARAPFKPSPPAPARAPFGPAAAGGGGPRGGAAAPPPAARRRRRQRAGAPHPVVRRSTATSCSTLKTRRPSP